MKSALLKSAGLGALLALAGSTAYVFFGPVDMLGIPEPRWAQILFWPGIYAGTQAWNYLSNSEPVIYVAAFLAMTLTGGLLGLVLGWLARRCLRPSAK